MHLLSSTCSWKKTFWENYLRQDEKSIIMKLRYSSPKEKFMTMRNLGLVRVGSAVPTLKVANTKNNAKEIISMIKQAEKNKTGVILFPELAITGYSCNDLFYQEHLYQSQLTALFTICEATCGLQITVILGCYLRLENNLYNCAALIQNGKIKGIVPKMFLPNSKEYYEGRWFASGLDLSKDKTSVHIFDYDIPFGNIIFDDPSSDLSIAMEICEDLWLPISPGSQLALNGAQIIFNPSASNETVGKADYRKNLVTVESAKCVSGYVYASSGTCESSTDVVFGGHCLVAENGIILNENQRFSQESEITYGEIDFQRLKFERSHTHNFAQCTSAYTNRSNYTHVELDPVLLIVKGDSLCRKYPQNPFVPEDSLQVDSRCGEIFNIQSAGLGKRIKHTHAKKSVVGISGGLDSTLALLVCAYTHKLLGLPAKDIVAITMPGFGTTGKTYNNALTIMKLLGTDVREISIKESVLQHFADIDQDSNVHDITYENSQARERTQILMDVANKEGGMVIGTGDLSEMALGWCTYNGDHMSMYGVNSSVPKTLVRFVVKWVMDNKLSGSKEDLDFSSDNVLLKSTLQDILDTPISPELLPPDKDGNIAQKTEEKVGPYVLHDFFIYYTLRYGMTPEKLLYTAVQAFAGVYDEKFIKNWMKTFYQRFFTQQFKRSCVPDGPKVGSVSLSPRGDWRMPSDADVEIWLDQLK